MDRSTQLVQARGGKARQGAEDTEDSGAGAGSLQAMMAAGGNQAMVQLSAGGSGGRGDVQAKDDDPPGTTTATPEATTTTTTAAPETVTTQETDEELGIKSDDKTPKHTATDFKADAELKKIKTSIIMALKMTKAALAKIKKGDTQYIQWMDAKATSSATEAEVDTRLAHVKAGFEKIEKCLTEDEVIFKKWDLPENHTLKYQGTFAYVRKAETENNMYLGGSFWVAKTKGVDSSAGTIIHELSHRLQDTSDHVYGTSGAEDLAKNDPDKATTNADNYEYMAEHS